MALGPGAPLLILHGGLGMPSAYLNCLANLASDRSVIFYDQLGCGRSDRPTASEGYFVKEHFIDEIEPPASVTIQWKGGPATSSMSRTLAAGPRQPRANVACCGTSLIHPRTPASIGVYSGCD